MNRYSIIIHLADGNVIDAKSVGYDQEEAISRLQATEQFRDFVKDTDIESVEIAFLEKVAPINPDNYVLQKSRAKAGWWLVTDIINNVVVQFQAHRFNDTAVITPLYDEVKAPIDTATILREIGEFMAVYHAELV